MIHILEIVPCLQELWCFVFFLFFLAERNMHWTGLIADAQHLTQFHQGQSVISFIKSLSLNLSPIRLMFEHLLSLTFVILLKVQSESTEPSLGLNYCRAHRLPFMEDFDKSINIFCIVCPLMSLKYHWVMSGDKWLIICKANILKWHMKFIKLDCQWRFTL